MKSATCLNKKEEILLGIDIGNSTTELALRVTDLTSGNNYKWFSTFTETTGTKGTEENVKGIIKALDNVSGNSGIDVNSIDRILINEATPVIGDFAMETVTETVITDSSVIGHNPNTPGGIGIGRGETITFREIKQIVDSFSGLEEDKQFIAVVSEEWQFDEVAETINTALKHGINISGAIMQKDDGVLVVNRLEESIPIVDEVRLINKIPIGALCVIEVARKGSCIQELSNPYGLAALFGLNAKETQSSVAIARALIGVRSAVVIKTPHGDVQERVIPSGQIQIYGTNGIFTADVKNGSRKIMSAVDKCRKIQDVKGTMGTNVGGMIENARTSMGRLTGQPAEDVTISDIFAIDTTVKRKVEGGIANEFFSEHAVGIAVMVKTKESHMEKIASKLQMILQVPVSIGGVEAEAAIVGALTTPGAEKPAVIVDIGAGTTDACYCDKMGDVSSLHLSGAGNMVTMIINSELNLNNWVLAEEIKKNPLAKVESFYSIKHEDGTIEYLSEPLDKNFYGKTVVVKSDTYIPFSCDMSVDRIAEIRRRAKKEVILKNVLRCLKKLSPTGTPEYFGHVILVGGSALDFEIGNMITNELAYCGATAGVANVRGCEGPRNAVATGLILSERNKNDSKQR